MSYSKFIARLVTQHRGLVWLAVVLMAAASIYILVTRLTLDTEVLNLLPGKFESVQGLKIYNNDFAQTRQLTFALVCQPNDADRLEEFAPVFAERLRINPGIRVSWPDRPWRPRKAFTTCRVWPCRSFSISNHKRLPKRSPACSQPTCGRGSVACIRKSMLARLGRSLNFRSTR